MPVSVPVKPARNDGTPGSSPPGTRAPRRSLASKQGIIIVRIRVPEYPGTEDSEDPVCRNGSILQRSSRRARAVPGVSVTQRDNPPPPPLESVPSQAIPCSDRHPHVQDYLLLLGEQTDHRPLSDWRISASGFRHIGPFFTNSGLHTIRMHMPTPSLAGSPDSTPVRLSKCLTGIVGDQARI